MKIKFSTAHIFTFFLLFLSLTVLAQPCDNNGNIVIFSNYDGGYLNINVNENIPNLKIGIASYEPTQVNITGTYAANVTAVIYAGYFPLTGTGNFHCDNNLAVGSVNPLPNPNATVEILSLPPVTLLSTDYDTTSIPGIDLLIGYNGGILGCHTCNTTEYTGGDNTADQIIDYFATTFNGTVRFLKTQYGCWCGTQDMSQPSTCCLELNNSSGGELTILSSGLFVCENQPVTLSAFGTFDSYFWSTGSTASTIQVDQPGTYTLQAINECGVFNGTITLTDCPEEICGNGADDDGDGLTDFLDPDCTCDAPAQLSVTQSGTGCDPVVILTAENLPGYIFQWFLDGVPLFLGSEPTLYIGNSVTNSGEYSIFAWNANGDCAVSDTFPVIFSDIFSTSATVTDVLCAGENTGGVSLTVLPAGNYTYQWSDSEGNVIGNGAAVNNLNAGDYTVVITNIGGCTDAVSYTIAEPVPLSLDYTLVQPACDGDSLGLLTLSATGGESPYLYYIDNGVAASDNIFNLLPGIYAVGVLDANGCEATLQNLNVTPADQPVIVINGPDSPVPIGETFTLQLTSNLPLELLTLNWTPGDLLDCDTCASVSGIALTETVFTVLATGNAGCIATDTFQVSIDPTTNVFIPNIFSPDFSGFNDVFKIYTGQGISGVAAFRIYDRWGNLLSEDINGWNGTFRGKEAPAGVYAWYAELLYIDGRREVMTGDVTLVR